MFLPGWEEGLFPHQRSLDEGGRSGLEEERRLAYVGITRARKRAFISFVGNRRMYGQWNSAVPSRFVDELPEDLVEASSDSGLYQAGRSQHWDSSGFQPKPKAASKHDRKVMSDDGTVFARGDRVFHDRIGVINCNGRLVRAQNRYGQCRSRSKVSVGDCISEALGQRIAIPHRIDGWIAIIECVVERTVAV